MALDRRPRASEGRILVLRLLPWLLLIGLIGALSYLRLLDLRLSPLRAQARTLLEQGIALTGSELADLSRSALVLGQMPAIGVAVLGLVAWVLIEAVDLSWLPGGRDGIRLTDEALHLGDTTFKIDELTGEVTWEPGHPEQLELGLTRGGTLPVETERPDELRNALRRALPA